MSERDTTSPLAAPERRLLARLIETVIELVPAVVGIFHGVAMGSRMLIRGGLIVSGVTLLAVAVLNLVWLHRYGQSVGKRILGLRIVRADGSRAGLGRLFVLRELVPFALFLVPLAGALFYLVDRVTIFGEERRCVHDRLADTIVIDVKAGEAPDTF